MRVDRFSPWCLVFYEMLLKKLAKQPLSAILLFWFAYHRLFQKVDDSKANGNSAFVEFLVECI